jgi:two-component system chemotaxis sensor kinase CheA
MDLADFDRDAVLASFLVESEEGLDTMEQALVQMESNPSDPELLPSIFRVAHSLKGNATSLGLSELAGFAHVVEDLLDVFREQQALPSADLISLLLKAVDELRAMVSAAKAGSQPLTAKQQKIRKEIAQEVEKRSKRILARAEPAGNPAQPRGWTRSPAPMPAPSAPMSTNSTTC